MSIYVLIASGGEYDDSWERVILSSRNREILEGIREHLFNHRQLYQEANSLYKQQRDTYMLAWEEQHSKPLLVAVTRAPKPKHPEPSLVIRALKASLGKKEYKKHPLAQEWVADLRAYEEAKQAWNKLDRELTIQEWAPIDNWNTLRRETEEAFYAENFCPKSGLPVEYVDVLNKYKSIIIDADDFQIEEVEEV